MAVTVQDDLAPENSGQTSGKTVPWGEHHALVTGDGQGLMIDTTDLINNANAVPQLKTDLGAANTNITNLQSDLASTNANVGTLQTQMTAVQTEAAGARVLQVTGVTLPIVIWNEAQIAKNLFPPDTVFVAEKTLISDADGTLAVYLGDADAANIRARTITATPIVVDDPSLLYNVPTHADLPTTQAASDALAGRTTGVGDYSGVQNDETMSGQSIRWFITAIDASGNITWGMPFIINSSQYQAQSTTGDSGKVLTGGSSAGTFGTSLSVDSAPTSGSNNLISSGAVATAVQGAIVRRTGTLNSGASWSGSAAPWTQTLSISNKTEGFSGLAAGASKAQYDAAAAAGIWVSARTDTTITFSAANERPSVAIPVEYIGRP